MDQLKFDANDWSIILGVLKDEHWRTRSGAYHESVGLIVGKIEEALKTESRTR